MPRKKDPNAPTTTTPRGIGVSATIIDGTEPAPANTFALWADALVCAACPELNAAQAIVQQERQRRSQSHRADLEADHLRHQLAEAEAAAKAAQIRLSRYEPQIQPRGTIDE